MALTVGEALGARVGDAVGTSVGLADGLAVGLQVCPALVGLRVGAAVGGQPFSAYRPASQTKHAVLADTEERPPGQSWQGVLACNHVHAACGQHCSHCLSYWVRSECGATIVRYSRCRRCLRGRLRTRATSVQYIGQPSNCRGQKKRDSRAQQSQPNQHMMV